jgi:glycosyltransferase involved in cell wall biosynthesis
MARVTIVVATANARDALLATVTSMLRQEFRDFELYITDDGSTDGTGVEILTRFGPDPARVEKVWWDSLREETGTRCVRMLRDGVPIHYLHQITSRGAGAARNRALALASGELLAFAHPDDVWRACKLVEQVSLLDANAELGALLVMHDRRHRKAASRRRAKLDRVTFEQIMECEDEPLSGALVRRSCLGTETPFDENLPVCEEYDFWLRMTSRFAAARTDVSYQTDATVASLPEWGLERFRVYALEKAYQSGQLSPVLRHRVAEELVRQCDLLVDGYRRRENHERANFYDRKKKRFSQEVAKLDVSDPVFSRSQTI